MSENAGIPNGWEWAKLGDVCEIILGQSPTSDTYNVIKEGLPFFQGKAEFTELYPIPEKWCSKPNKIAEPFDILLSVRAPVGAINIADKQCCIGRGLAAIRYPENYKFICHYLKSIEQILDAKGTGTTFKAISGEIIREQSVPIPPILEQHRIVAKIEALFSSLDKGIESLKTAQQQLKVYRQAVLKWAFEGKLTNDYVKDGELPDGWKWVKLGDLAEKIQIGPFGSQLHKEDYTVGGIPLINPMHIKDGFIVADTSFSISKIKRDSLPNYILKEGDVIMGRRGEMGRCGLVNKKEDGWFCGTGSLYIRPKGKIVNSFFLYHCLKGETVKKYLDENAAGTTMANLNSKIVTDIPVPLPLLHEQQAIVSEIESRLSVCDKLEESITHSLKQAEALRQSILKKAFEGKLVPQDPNDESANVLLERIKAEKEKNKQEKKVKLKR